MKKIISKAKEYAFVIVLGAVLALDYRLFIVENNFAPAGINGIATMIQYKCGFSIGYMSLIINVPLCVFAFFFIDKKYAAKTLTFCVAYSLFYLFMGSWDIQRFKYVAADTDVFPAVIAGAICGVVSGFLYKASASTGGTDVVSKFLSIKKPQWNFFYVTFVINAAVAVASLFVYADINEKTSEIALNYLPVCKCIAYAFISNFIGNLILRGCKTACKFIVVTTHAEEINDEIIAKLKHTSTRIVGYGGYSQQEKSILLCVVNKHQMVDFQSIIKKYDNTFAVAENVNETVGNFKKIK